MTLPTDGTVIHGWQDHPPVKNPTIEQRIYAVARWAADLAITEMRDGTEHALLLRDAGPGQYIPSEDDWGRINDTTKMGINYVLHGSVEAPHDYAEVYQGEDRKWYYRVRAANHEVIDGSQGYASSGNVRRALNRTHPGIEVRQS